MHCYKVPNNNGEMLFLKKNLQFDFIMCRLSKSRFVRARFKKKKRRLKLWSRDKKSRVKITLKQKTKFKGFKVWSKRKKKKKKFHHLATVKVLRFCNVCKPS